MSSIVSSIVTFGRQLLPYVGKTPYINLTGTRAHTHTHDTSLLATSSQLRLVTVTSQEASRESEEQTGW